MMHEDSPSKISGFMQILFKKKWHAPFLNRLDVIVKRFSLTEKIIFYALALILGASSLTLLLKVNNAFLVEVPAPGGTLIEGVAGIPRFINPLLAISDADKDITALVYSGLLKATPDGTLIPDLAQSYSTSPDGLTYSFILRDNGYFQDGFKVTADDVIFTVKESQDPTLKSPKRGNWEGVSVEKINDKEVRFTLKQPYSPFLENATLGILPKHIWGSLDTDQFTFSTYNNNPIGSGPYQIKTVKRDSSGLPTSYDLVPFPKHTLGAPFISHIIFKFFQDETAVVKAYDAGTVNAIMNISPETATTLATRGARIETTPLPRIFGIFFNQNQATIFADKNVRQALNTALDKKAIIKEALGGFGVALEGPVPIGFLPPHTVEASLAEKATSTDRLVIAKQILAKDGWQVATTTSILTKKTKKNTEILQFIISTADMPELTRVAQLVANTWTKLGVAVTVKPFESSDLNQNVIRPRKYDALLFGEIVGRDLDFFPFWHSSQRNDPGLNIALYANTTADKLLLAGRGATTTSARATIYEKFENTVLEDVPAVFLYSPDFIYILPKSIKNLKLGKITTGSERFIDVEHWYIETDKVWKIFLKNY